MLKKSGFLSIVILKNQITHQIFLIFCDTISMKFKLQYDSHNAHVGSSTYCVVFQSILKAINGTTTGPDFSVLLVLKRPEKVLKFQSVI